MRMPTAPSELTTACTPVAIFNGTPDLLPMGKGVTLDDQQGRVAALIASAKRLGGRTAYLGGQDGEARAMDRRPHN